MTGQEAERIVASYWMDKARASLASARLECDHGNFDFSVNRSYYASFYAATALLMLRGKKFVKHSGVRAAVHRELAQSGEFPTELARWYDNVFDARQKGDYLELARVSQQEAEGHLDGAQRFVDSMATLFGA